MGCTKKKLYQILKLSLNRATIPSLDLQQRQILRRVSEINEGGFLAKIDQFHSV